MKNRINLFPRRNDVRKILRKAQVRIRLPIPFISYEIPLNDIIDPQNIDTRISRLGDIKKELESAIDAVTSLQIEAQENKGEVENLRVRIRELEEDKSTAETVLKVPQESFARLVERANSKGRMRGWIEGLIIGLISGVISSLAVSALNEKINTPSQEPPALEETIEE
jgi:hypothetical protein